MIDLLLFWGLPLIAGLAGATLAFVWRERARSFPEPSFELVSVASGEPIDLKRYFATLTKFTQEAERSILIVDYLAHHGSLKGDIIFELYNSYFREIEKVVTNKGLRYTRIVQLPLPRVARNRNEKIVDGLSLMFVEAFHHIDRMLSSTADFKLYILNAAFRPYSFIVIDDKAILTEYDRYTLEGTSVADHIIINRLKASSPLSSQVADLVKIQKDWCNRLIRKEKPVSTSELLELAPQLQKRSLTEVELHLALSDAGYRDLLRSFDLDDDAIRNVRYHEQEAVRKNLQGSQKKLESVGVLDGNS